MASSGAYPNQEKQQNFEGPVARNYIKEDGIRKELYLKEAKAQEKWEEKWGFLKNRTKLLEEEMRKLGIKPEKFNKRKAEESIFLKCKDLNIQLLPSGQFPKLSSGMIGWRSSKRENDLDKSKGPLYVSPKMSMEPPTAPDEPDLKHQHFLILG